MTDSSHNIRKRTGKALSWRFATIAVRVVLQLAVICVLSRLLSIDDFGLVAEAMIVVGFLTTFSEVGMAPVLIQKRDVTAEQRDTALTLALITGMLMCGGIWLVSPFIAWTFQTPDVSPILRGMSFSFLFASMGTTAAALLQRDLNFKTLFKVDSLAYLVGYAVPGIVMAMYGFGAWSLVAATLGQSILQLCLVLFFSGTRLPWPTLKRENVQELVGSAAGYSVARLVFYCARNADFAVLAATIGSHPLGLYSRAYQLMTIPISRFSGVVNTVLFPAYSRMEENNDSSALRTAFLESVGIVACVLFPLLTIMAVLGDDIIVGLLSAKWRAAGFPFSVLCLGGTLLAIHNLGDTLARSRALHTARIWRHTVYLALVAGLTFVAAGRGLNVVAMTVTGVIAFQYLLMSHLVVRATGLSFADYFLSQRSGTLMAIVGAGAAFLVSVPLHQTPCPSIVTAVIAGIAGVVAAGLLVLTLPSTWLPAMIDRGRRTMKNRVMKSHSSDTALVLAGHDGHAEGDIA